MAHLSSCVFPVTAHRGGTVAIASASGSTKSISHTTSAARITSRSVPLATAEWSHYFVLFIVTSKNMKTHHVSICFAILVICVLRISIFFRVCYSRKRVQNISSLEMTNISYTRIRTWNKQEKIATHPSGLKKALIEGMVSATWWILDTCPKTYVIFELFSTFYHS